MSHASRAAGTAARVRQAARTVTPTSRPNRPRPESATVADALTDLPASVAPVFETVTARNPHEPEFHQAVHEVLHSIAPVLDLSLIHI